MSKIQYRTFVFTETQVQNILLALTTADIVHQRFMIDDRVKGEAPVADETLARQKKIMEAKRVFFARIAGGKPRGV
jgi:hypothetical protein